MSNIITRRIIGILAMSLPVLLILTNILFGVKAVQDSISHYYYTPAIGAFALVLGFTAMFLIIYKGYDRFDRVACFIAGVSAIGIILFPTNANEDSLFSWHTNTNIIHFVFSGVFFITLAVISLFLFTKSIGYATEQKIRRNALYRICGIIILSATVLIVLFHFAKIYWVTLWLEWIGIIAFGISWLTKGETILKDK